jgi:hypothetical protein
MMAWREGGQAFRADDVSCTTHTHSLSLSFFLSLSLFFISISLSISLHCYISPSLPSCLAEGCGRHFVSKAKLIIHQKSRHGEFTVHTVVTNN